MFAFKSLNELFVLATCSCGVRPKIKAKMLEGSERNWLVKQERVAHFRFFFYISNAITKLVAVFPLQQLCCFHFVITSSGAHLTVITSSPIAICVGLSTCVTTKPVICLVFSNSFLKELFSSQTSTGLKMSNRVGLFSYQKCALTSPLLADALLRWANVRSQWWPLQQVLFHPVHSHPV